MKKKWTTFEFTGVLQSKKNTRALFDINSIFIERTKKKKKKKKKKEEEDR